MLARAFTAEYIIKMYFYFIHFTINRIAAFDELFPYLSS
nr:MAG TPA: hypothetical protein [Caudoviricetes sp.]